MAPGAMALGTMALGAWALRLAKPAPKATMHTKRRTHGSQ